MREGWKCPNCGKAHGPHVDTCPDGGTKGIRFDGPVYVEPNYLKIPSFPYQEPDYVPWRRFVPTC